MPPRGPGAPAQRQVAQSRVAFLTAETPAPRTVRGPILASWRRSEQLHVAADKIDMSYDSDLPLDTKLTRSAEPVLRSLESQLEGQSVSVILTDPRGVVLRRLTGDGDLERHLDRVLLAPGFSYAEQHVGTNGIGTALEIGGPAHVFGHEHYAEDLEELACAGVPIHHPLSGRLVGAVDLTCWRRDAGALLMTLAKTTAEQIRQSLLADTGARELQLFQEYLRACSRRSGVVFAVSHEVVILNDYARTVLDAADQGALVARATEGLTSAQQSTTVVELPTGVLARMYCRPVSETDRSAGIVAHVKLGSSSRQALRVPERTDTPGMALPGLVGSSPPWTHVCHEVERAFKAGEWLALEGEPGVGKLALLRAVQLRRHPVGRFLVVRSDEARDAAWLTSARSTIAETDAVAFTHVDRLDEPALRNLSSALQEATAKRGRPLWVAVTLTSSAQSPGLAHLLRQFPSTVEVPPLRLRLDDLDALVPLFLSRISQRGRLTCSPETMRVLRRMSWPGNSAQVQELLREVVKHRRTGRIEPADLPPEAHALSRRMLSPLESLERDAIVRCLADAGGNKLQAAKALGMSRATIYRKIREFGIVPHA